MARRNFEVLSEDSEENEDVKMNQFVFNGPLGKIKLEFVTKPLVIGKKTHYSKRMGSSATVDYITSATEKVNTLFAFKWDQSKDDWSEIDPATFNN